MSLTILGCKLDDIGPQAATDFIMERVRAKAPAQIVTLGTEMVVHAQRDEAFRGVVNHAALSLCDTIGLLLVARMRGSALRERVTGVDLIARLCDAAQTQGHGVYLLGGAPGVADEAARVLQKTFPGLRIRGTQHGYFKDDESPRIAGAIATSGAQILFAGLGFPRQDFWIYEYLEKTGCTAALGIGGSFDVLSGKVERAPESWRRLGLEWLYRLYREPHRWRRQLALPYFVWLVIVDALRRAAFRSSTNP
ncbi:MAG: WecB/TagA/CpsF family glycosyltransferase [Candidatus Eremiobacteraeota bacterium]|nr:WecB/TagA/CpsF family glycosyltransferase [Candidatus Eremiobacteraeota bacterium]